MAKVTEAQSSARERLIQFLKLEDRFNELDRTRRWSAKAMKQAAIRHFPEQRLRALWTAITEAPDGGVLPGLVRRIIRDVVASPRYGGFIAPSRCGHILALFPGMADQAQHDLNRFDTSIAEVYALAVLLASEDEAQAHIFGPCDDPDAALREMDDVQARMNALKEDLRTRFSGEDVAYGDVVLVGGRRMAAATWRITNGEVEFGAPVESLIGWARQHRGELGG